MCLKLFARFVRQPSKAAPNRGRVAEGIGSTEKNSDLEIEGIIARGVN
jgi:hypothetical protein